MSEVIPIPWPPANDGKSVWLPFRYRGRLGIWTVRGSATGRTYRFGSSAEEQVKWVAGSDAEQLARLADLEQHPTFRIDWAAEAQQRELAAESAKAEEALERRIRDRIAEAEAGWREAAVAEASRRQKPALEAIGTRAEEAKSEVKELEERLSKKRRSQTKRDHRPDTQRIVAYHFRECAKLPVRRVERILEILSGRRPAKVSTLAFQGKGDIKEFFDGKCPLHPLPPHVQSAARNEAEQFAEEVAI